MNDTLIFLVLAGIALIFKWLTSHTAEDSEKPEPPSPNEPIRRPPAQSDEERVRRFLEALGQPEGSQPPAPVQPRSAVKPRTITPRKSPKVRRGWAQPLPPLVTTPKESPPRPLPPLSAAQIEAEPIIVPLPPQVAIAPLRPAVSVQKLQDLSSLGKMLRSRAGLRQAVVLREILGPPRGLEALVQSRVF